MKKVLLFIPLLLISISAICQDENFFNPISSVAKVPQSPEVAAFGKFSTDVNMYSGTPSIGIPIYTIAGKEVSVPVSLSYDASGIKVDQIATNIGLGWNLNFGGVVTRNVNGFPDDVLNSQAEVNNPITASLTRNWLNYIASVNKLHDSHSTTQNAEKARDFFKWYQRNEVDHQPDTFSFNVNGVSGTFFIDYENPVGSTYNAYCLDNPNVKITVNFGGYSSFVITDTTTGTIYTFAESEITHHDHFGGGGVDMNEYSDGQYITAWYLSKIESVNGLDKFDFEYYSDTWDEAEPYRNITSIEIKDVGNGNYQQQASYDLGTDNYYKDHISLARIKYNGDEVLTTDFALNRDDLKGVRKISGLNIKDRLQSVLLNVDFEQSYFAPTSGTLTATNQRLKLDKVIMYRDNMNDPKEYSFIYNSPNGVPDRRALSVDFWGYNNDAPNQHLAPRLTGNDNVANYYNEFNNTFPGYPGAIRTPNLLAAQKGTIQSITFPTGGRTTFEYEGHEILNSGGVNKVVGGLRIKSISNETLDPVSGENDVLTTYYFYDDLKTIVTANPSLLPTNAASLNQLTQYSSGIAQQDIMFNEEKLVDEANGTTALKKYLLTNNRAVAAPNNITYTSVTQLQFNNDKFNGCNITQFYNGTYDGVEGAAIKSAPYFNSNLDYGEVEYSRIYDENLNLLQETHNTYVNNDLALTDPSALFENVGILMFQNNDDNGVTLPASGYNGCERIYLTANNDYRYAVEYYNGLAGECLNDYWNSGEINYSVYKTANGYDYRQYWKELRNSTTRVFENGQTQEQITNYSYTSSNHKLPTQITTTDSKGRVEKTEITYCSDHVSLVNYPNLTVLQDMVARNQLGVPVETIKFYQRDQNPTSIFDEISRQRQVFDDFTPTGQSNGFSLIKPSKVQVSKGIALLEDRIIYHEYDPNGNLTEVSYPGSSTARHSYLWGYKGDHLLAEIKNASLSGVGAILQTTIDNIVSDSDVENTSSEENSLRTALNNLRSDPYFEDAQLSVYTYDPGIGVKSVTDIRDYTSFYFYDQHNRLDYATDESNRVLGKNEYIFRVNEGSGENYIKTTNYQKEFVISQINNDAPLDNDKIESISYSDGMGRLKQSIALRGGGNRENIVQYIEYDDLGREARKYLPYASTSSGSNYVPLGTASASTAAFYNTGKYGNTTNPYSENNFEKSPRSRVLETGAPGSSWEVNFNSDTDHTVKTEYSFNNGVEVRKFDVSYTSQGASPQLTYDNYYGLEELSKITVKDENWQPSDGLNNLTQTFTNKSGQLLLKRQKVFDAQRTIDQTYTMDTYYIYDDFGNLAFVLSPKASDAIVDTGGLVSNYQEILDLYAYQYKYDDRNRLIWKKIPGRGYEEVFYDRLDRPVLTQDANLRADNQFLFTKYDAFDRVVYTGIYSPTPPASPSRTDLENSINGGDLYETRTTTATNIDGTNVYYTKGAFPSSGIEVLTVNYYDSYVDTGGVGLPPGATSYGTAITSDTDGLPTVSKVKVLHDNVTEDWITTVTGYDVKGRPIYIKSENPYLEKTDLLESKLDFTGKALETTTIHYDDTGNNPDITIIDYFNYDHVGRLLTQEQQIDDSPVQLIAENVYDNMGQLLQKNVGGETFVDGYTSIQNVDVSGDIIVEKVGTSSSYDAGLLTRGKFKSEGGVQFKVLTPDKELRVGFHTGSSAQIEPYETLHYGVICTAEAGSGAGNYKLKYVDGSTIAYASVNYKLNDVITVERVDVGSGVYNIEYSINSGAPFYTATGNISTSPLLGKAVFYDPNGKIEDFELVGNNIDKILQNIDYKYNVRGWMTDINNVDGAVTPGDTDIFSFRINYNDPVAGTASAPSLFNGNISQTVWRTINDNVKRGYSYEYDQIDRLINATGRKGNNLDTATDFNLDTVTYDINGNIETLKRYGDDPNSSFPLLWDDLTYVYSGNQLLGVGEVGSFDEGFLGNGVFQTSFAYDVNGNMISDAYKGITSITYNHLDLPEVISIYNGTFTHTISYVYDATGVKLSKSVIDEGNTITLYAGGFVYSGQGVASDLQFISQPEGYIIPVSTQGGVSGFDKGSNTTIFSSYDYVFQFTDHLGNVRLSYSDILKDGVINPSTDIVEESNYYPFGLKHLGYNSDIVGGNDVAQAWKFGGKELNAELGLDWYDVSARNYDPALGRWMNIDPLAGQMRRHSPYNFAFDNPIYFQDYDGMAPSAPDTVIVTGDLADAAVEDLNAASSLTVTKNSKGVLEASGEALTDADKALEAAINDKSIVVNLNATSKNFDEDGFAITGGTFGGSEVKGEIVEATQIVNPDQMQVIDDVTQRGEGVGTLHEVIESYDGAKNSPGASKAVQGIPNEAYTNAHDRADAIDPRHNADYRVSHNLVGNGNNVTVIRSVSSGDRAKNLVNQTMTKKEYNKMIRKSTRAFKKLKRKSN